eukprot:NODE_5083_length_1810_cov_5.221628.p1 GENE.NODE_5083_length_1810_cov_5.221628~~NODE_5083_length_1810_cov_5.221628.p1  ORF type:complete len:481 (+),score=111.75 NODE_5083_length_1810_cov_5.221628:90-1532(+)
MASTDATEPVNGGTYYEVLGVSPTASVDEIRIQYRKLALKLHPDKNRNDPNATQRFQELQEAYEVLSDEERRIAYDQNSDFIFRAFNTDTGGDEDQHDSFLSVPASRTFWCLMVEAVLADDAKVLNAYAGQLADSICTELCQGGVCGFTLLHFAAFAGKSKTAQALIDLGANVNAKTQPLCVTPSQQFCRPTPLDLTMLTTNKKAREVTQKVLMAADGQYGAVDLAKLESLWQGIIRHQLLLIREEVLRFTQKIPPAARRVLRTEPRWREVVHFPGEEDAASMESRRMKRTLRLWKTRLIWVLLGDTSASPKRYWAVRGWNLLIIVFSWWLFNYDYFQVVQATLVSIALMIATSWCRLVPPEAVRRRVPPRERVEEWLAIAWALLGRALESIEACVCMVCVEAGEAHALGLSAYAERAKVKLVTWSEQRHSDSDGTSAAKWQPSGIAQRLARFFTARGNASSGGSDAPRRPRHAGRRRAR